MTDFNWGVYTNDLNDLDYKRIGTDRWAVRGEWGRFGFELLSFSLDGPPSVSSKVPSGTTEGAHSLPRYALL